MVVTERGPQAGRAPLAPLFILLAVVAVLGIGFLLSAVNVRFRDVRYMIPASSCKCSPPPGAECRSSMRFCRSGSGSPRLIR